MRRSVPITLLAVALAHGCADPDAGDPIDDSFVTDGKTDGGISEGSAEAVGVLAVVNTLDKAKLDNEVGLDSRAATKIAAHRAGADATLDTADDDRFDTLHELDAVPYVGKKAFAKLLAYAQANGFVHALPMGRQVSTCESNVYAGTAVCGDTLGTRELPSVTGMKLDTMLTFGANDVWAAGDGGTLLHFDGQTWSTDSSPICEDIYALWGTSSTDLWAVGNYGRVMHRTAAGWQLIDIGTCAWMNAITGTSANDVWISGVDNNHPFLMHGGLQGFTKLAGFDGGFDSMWAFAPDDVWGVGGGALEHFDGTSWTLVYQQHVDFEHIWAPDRDHIFVGGFDWDKNKAATWRFSEATAAAPLEDTFSGNYTPAIHGTSPTDVWFVVGSQIHHFDGTKWTYIAQPTQNELLGMAASAANDVWAVGYAGDMVHWNGTAWSAGNQAHALFDVWGSSATNAWAASSTGILHYDGTSWTPAGVAGFFYSLWGTAANNVYAVGLFNKVKHYDGTSWSDVTMPQNAGSWWTIAGTGANDVYVGGYQGAFAHFDGTTWTASKPITSNINALWAPAPKDVWAATSGGLLHYDGTSWATAGPLNVGEMYAVWGTSSHDIWATGYAVWHYDGNTWTQMLAQRSLYQFPSVWGSGANDVWVNMSAEINFSSTHLLHWDGSTWTTYVNALGERVRDGFSVGGVTWAPEQSGGMLRLDP